MTSHLLENSYLKTHELEIGTFRFYDSVIIGQIREGMQVTLDDALPLLALGWEQYRNRPVVYISDRKYSYSLDPTMHFETKKLVPYLSGYAWVVYNRLNEQNARLEARFLDCPTQICSSLDAAIAWAGDLLKRQQLD